MKTKGPQGSAATLLEDLGIEQPEDIDIEAIAQHCGATVVYGPLGGCEARIVGVGDQALIRVRDDSPEPRRRFSVAHELGHWLRDRGKVHLACQARDFLTEWSADNPETRANRFASEVLLPERTFSPDCRGREMTFGTVRSLAERYRTSLTATAIRLTELGSFPTMLVCSEAGRRWRWFVRWPDLPRGIWPLDRPGPDTVAAGLLAGSNHEPGPTDVAASGWVDQARAGRQVVREDSVVVGRGLVLSLVWWCDEDQLLELV